MSDARHSPGKLLANVSESSSSRLILLSGPSGCGKTSWCLQLVQLAGQHKLSAEGLVSPAVFQAGKKTAIDLMMLPHGPSHRLAIRRQEEAKGVLTEEWHFDESQIAWGERHLASLRNPELLVIDELGPLEFLNGKGWQAAFPLIEQRAYRLAVVVIRPGLLSAAQGRWPWAETWHLAPLATKEDEIAK